MSVVHAQTFGMVKNNPVANSIITKIVDVIVTPAIEILFLFATLVFIYGIFKLIANAGEPKARQEGQQTILWGIVGMFIMVSVYGIIRLIANTIGVADPFL